VFIMAIASACTAIVDWPPDHDDSTGSLATGTGSGGAGGASTTGPTGGAPTTTNPTTSTTHGTGGIAGTGTGTGTGTGGAKVSDAGSDVARDAGHPDAGAEVGPPGSCVLDHVLGGQSTFNGWFQGRNNVYTYVGLCTALAKPLYSKFASSGDVTADKREVAAFFAHVAWETGNLVFTDQQQKDPATGMYWGRGPLQLTWDYNYKACGSAIGQPLLAQPDLVSRDSVVTWETALWFWLYDDSGKGFTSHTAIGRGSFGDTLRVINSIECVAGNNAQQGRINNYTSFSSRLMVDPGTQLTCQ
jgi:chitinase